MNVSDENPQSGDNRLANMDEELNARLEGAFHNQTAHLFSHELAKIACEYDPIDLAHAVTRLPPYARVELYENLPDFSAKIIFIINAGSNTRVAIFRQIDDQEIKRLVEQMPPDEAVWVLDDLSDRRLKRLLELLDVKKAQRIRELQKHDRHSAGRLMTNEFFAFHMNTTVGEVAEQIRNNPGIDLTRRIFVLNEGGELIGFVPARTLIVNSAFLPLRQVMCPILHKVLPDAPRDEVVELVERYQIPALPVVDEQDVLVGVITYEDVVDALEDIANDTIASIAGTAEDVSEYEPILKRFLLRAPWLLVTLCAGLIMSVVMTQFTDQLWFAFVPFFVPLITGMSGNVGIQCSTILIRGMSTGQLSLGSRGETIGKELLTGLLIGVIFGVLCGLVIFTLTLLGANPNPDHFPHYALVSMVSCGVLGACLTATTLGTLSPFFFARFGIDPAVASGPIVTACNDVLSTLIFFAIARAIYGLF